MNSLPDGDGKHFLAGHVRVVIQDFLSEIGPESGNVIGGVVGQSRLVLFLGVENIFLQKVLGHLRFLIGLQHAVELLIHLVVLVGVDVFRLKHIVFVESEEIPLSFLVFGDVLVVSDHTFSDEFVHVQVLLVNHHKEQVESG